MKSPNPSPEDKPLTELLHQWKVNASLPPRFEEAVWRRIERGQAPPVLSMWDVISRWIGTTLPRPAMAAAYVAVLLVIGGSVGWTQAHEKTARVKEELGQRYVRVLDPYLASRE